VDDEAASQLRKVVTMLARQLNASATSEGLTPTHVSVLALVVGRGPVSLSALGELEGLNPTMLSRVIGKLDDVGLIRRVPDPSDLRTAWAEATQSGIDVYGRIKAQRTAIVIDSVRHLSDEHVASLTQAIPALDALAAELRTGGRRSK
jgi:DNA-binding MarR family transcriptional regulator